MIFGNFSSTDDEDWAPHHSEEKSCGQKPSRKRRRTSGQKPLRTTSGEKPRKKPRLNDTAAVRTRAFHSNKKKLQLLNQFDVIKKSGSCDPDAEFSRLNPSVPLNTMKKWLQPAIRTQIEADGKSKRPAVRDSRVSSSRLEKYRAKFPLQENELFDKICLRRDKGERVSFKWTQSEMKLLVRRDEPAGHETFRASKTWRKKFFRRFLLTRRVTTNTKSRTVEERIPYVRGFHLKIKDLQKPLPRTRRRCKIYGRYPQQSRYHVDQVPLEFGGLHNTTVDRIGVKRVHVKAPKIDPRTTGFATTVLQRQGPENQARNLLPTRSEKTSSRLSGRLTPRVRSSAAAC